MEKIASNFIYKLFYGSHYFFIKVISNKEIVACLYKLQSM